jgi:hypothetical protein
MPPDETGNEMSDDSKSFALENAVWKSVSELFWTSVGNPHDIGTNDVMAKGAIKAIARITDAARKNLFIIILPSSTTIYSRVA